MRTLPASVDVLVIGSGAGGLAAAVTAAHLGLSVLVAEKTDVFGGTTAWSGGWLWIPHNPLAEQAGITEPPQAPRDYLRAVLGNHYDAARIDAFLAAGPRMIDFFRQHTQVQFLPGNSVPDFHGELPGALTGGRSVVAAPYDGRALGPLIAQLRRPIPETTLFGMGIASGTDLAHFMSATRKPASLLHVLKRLGRHGRDLLAHRRSMQLVNGNALAARLLRSAADAGVALHTGLGATRLLLRHGRIQGVEFADATVLARRGVVLATGGFPHDPARHSALFPPVHAGTPHHSAAPATNAGDGMRMAEEAGAAIDDGQASGGAWAPVSLVPRKDGSFGHFPHLLERGKPGIIAVARNGRRFVNEAGAYHDFMLGLFAATPPGAPVEAWLICDHPFIRRYGLGAAKPAPLPLGPHLRSFYIRRAETIPALAASCGIDAAGLQHTIETFNAAARHGADPEFGRGGNAYQRMQGDATRQPNPCVAPIARGPFYAVRIVPGSLGTFAGIRTNAQAQVLDRQARPIPGLYAAGNDMSSVMGGHYPSGGITLGPAMAFGWVAAHHMAQHAAQAEGEMDGHGSVASVG